MDVDTALRSYSSHKGWWTRAINSATNLLQFLHQEFSSDSHAQLQTALQKAEKQLSILMELSDWLHQAKFDKAKDHLDEVKKMGQEWENYDECRKILFNRTKG